MNRLETIGEGLKELFDKVESNTKTEDNSSIFIAMGNDTNQSLFFDVYNRDAMSYEDYILALIRLIGESCGQTEDNGEMTLSANALLEAIVNFTARWCLDNPSNKEKFEKCIQFYLDGLRDDSKA